MKRSRSPKSRLEVVYARHRGAIVSVRVRGHAGFAVAGRDIVCAAASALILSAAQGLRSQCGVSPKVVDTAEEFRLDIPGGGNVQAQAVLGTAIAGLEAIAASYPGYMRIKRSNVASSRRTIATGPRPRRAKTRPSRAR